MQAKVFGSIIRELRELRGITQLQLAAQLNVSRSTITNWEQPADSTSVVRCLKSTRLQALYKPF